MSELAVVLLSHGTMRVEDSSTIADIARALEAEGDDAYGAVRLAFIEFSSPKLLVSRNAGMMVAWKGIIIQLR